MAQRQVLGNLQALRAVAALMVALYHARVLSPFGEAVQFEFGNAGVDIFFFISGFIIPYTTAGSGGAVAWRFAVKRAIRLLPLYWPLTLAVFVMMQLAPSLAGKGGVPDVTMLARSLLFIPHFNGAGEIYPVVFVGWTLNMEVFFYGLFAAGLLIPDQTRRIAVLFVVLVALELWGWLIRPAGAVAMAYTDQLIIEFGIGLWLSLAFAALPARQLGGQAATALILAIVVAAGLLIAGDYAWVQIPRLLKWGAPALVIVSAALILERGGVSMRGRAVMLLGEASYAIYLVHPFVIKAASIALARMTGASLALQVLAMPLTCLVIILVSIGAHLWCEAPVMRQLRRLALSPAAPTANVEAG